MIASLAHKGSKVSFLGLPDDFLHWSAFFLAVGLLSGAFISFLVWGRGDYTGE